MNYKISLEDQISTDEIVALYKANGWSSANKPNQLLSALRSSHSLVTARLDSILVGVGNAISDSHLVVYYPHMLVHPEHQRKGVGRAMMREIQKSYTGFHQQILVADGEAIDFYRGLGFTKAGRTQPMWIYQGNEH